MHAYVNMALRAARRAGQIMVQALDRLPDLNVEEKSRNDFVSNVDRDAEAAIVEILRKAYPDHAILGEEGGRITEGNAENAGYGGQYTWIIDPLDGTLNYLQGIPHFCISIGVMRGAQFEHAVVVDPLRNEEFTASRGGGAQLNGKRMRVSTRNRLAEAVLSTGIPPGSIDDHLDAYMATVKEFTSQCRGVRRMGSAALDLAYVASGRIDGFWELGLSPWDIAAGALLVREAGGFVGDWRGGDSFFRSGNIVASNPKCFRAMVQTLRPHLTPAIA
ncbi:MAG: inositol monophosphatase [Pseudomonadales bacterium]|nr:inositol monophosphatase [Pseudomonadales bacterium]